MLCGRRIETGGTHACCRPAVRSLGRLYARSAGCHPWRGVLALCLPAPCTLLKAVPLPAPPQAIRREAPRIGGSFAVWGGLFSTFDCTLVALRKKEDPWNSIAAGALTGEFFGLWVTRNDSA